MTWLSHMLDCQLFGVNPGAHHLMSVGYHAANAVLLFVFLQRITGAFWRSAMVAALFAWHPLQVDSVAWIAERKNLVSTFFLLLCLMAYVRYVHKRSLSRYALVFLLLSLAVMAKPAAVVAPCLMLVLDFWPLGRLGIGDKVGQPVNSIQSTASTSAHCPSPPQPSAAIAPARLSRTIGRLLLEKVPLLIPVAFTSVATVLVHRAYHALPSLSDLPFSIRVLNASVSYLRYAGKALWPIQLAIFYPLPKSWPVWLVAVAVGFLAAVSVLAVKWASIRPWFLAGWLWFLGGLFPNIGLVQAGTQALGDRFIYVPLIGLSIMVIWLAAEWLAPLRRKSAVLTAIAVLPLVAALAVTSRQVRHWRNTITVFEHAVAVTENNTLAHDLLAATFAYQGKTEQAITHCKALLAINPNSAAAHRTWGEVLERKGDFEQALPHFSRAVELDPAAAAVRYDLARALCQAGQTEQAIRQYQALIDRNPDEADARDELAWILATSDDPKCRDAEQAIDLARRAVSLTHEKVAEPWLALAAACHAAHRTNDAVEAVLKAMATQTQASIQNDIARDASGSSDIAAAFTRQGYAEAGIALLSDAARWVSNSAAGAEVQRQIGLILSEQAKYGDAASHYEAALRTNPRLAEAHNDWGVDLAAQHEYSLAQEHFTRALEIAPRYAVAHRNLALTMLPSRRYEEARSHLHEAIRLKPDYVSALNDLAWLLATCADANLRNGSEALRLAKRAARLTARKDAGILETLAAAYAEKGDFAEAANTAEQAIQLCDAATHQELLATLHNCVQRFRSSQPLRE